MSGIIAQNVLDNSGLVKAPEGGGAWNFIKKLTASASGDLSFVDGTSDVVLDSTYKEYVFTFNNMHVGTDGQDLQFNVSIDSGSNYNVAKTTTTWRALHGEDDSAVSLGYQGDKDLAQGTGVQMISQYLSSDNDASCSGTLTLFNPSSTTFVKHFICRMQSNLKDAFARDQYIAGYANTTSAVDAVQFTMQSGNIDLGDICLYGLTT